MSYHHSLRERPCGVDSSAHRQFLEAAPVHAWELHIGTVQLFIVGPGHNAWLACSKPCYQEQVGTEEERNLARRAVLFLNKRHREDKDAGPDAIKAALAFAATGKPIEALEPVRIPVPARPVKIPGILSIRSQEKEEPIRVRPEKQPPPYCPFTPTEIVAKVAAAFDITLEVMMEDVRLLKAVQARTLAMFLVQRATGWSSVKMGRFFKRDHASALNAARRHPVILANDSSYQDKVTVIQAEIFPQPCAV